LQFFLRLSPKQNEDVDVSQVTNKLLKSERQIKVTLSPVPEWLQDATCYCGNPAKYVLSDMSLVCPVCLDKMLAANVTYQEVADVGLPVTQETIKRIKFQWAVDPQGTWYNVSGWNLKPKNWDAFIVKVKSMILNKKEIPLDGDYDKNTKELLILE